MHQARVVIVGCGALGSFQAAALARAGVGKLLLIDRDTVEWSNLQRQWLYTEADAQLGSPKATAAAAYLRSVNSEIQIEGLVADLHAANVEDLLDGASLVLDATDNFETRFLLNDFCVRQGIPWVYGAAVGSYGLSFPVLPQLGPCLRCIYPEPPTGAQPTCETAGVLNTITSLVASWQVALATRILSQGPESIPLELHTFDSWNLKTRAVPISADPNCPCCVQMRWDYLDGRRRAPISLCGRNAVQIHERHSPINLSALASQLTPLGVIRQNEFALRFSPDSNFEITVFPDGRAIIKGTSDPSVARSLYARYIGR